MRLLYLFICFWATASVQAQSDEVIKLPETINSSYQELAPILSADGTQLYFSRAKHPQNMGLNSAADIWLSIKKANGTWSKAINVGAPVNSNQKDQPVGLSVAIQQMQVYNKDKKSLKRFVKKGRSWSTAIPQQIKNFQPKTSKIEYFSSYDGRILMISQEDSLSIGKNDIYVSFLESADLWSVPIHCGASLNSVYDELSMFLAADNKTLYFVSNRPGGEGQMDLYYSQRLDDTWDNWSKPLNLGPAINTKDNERSICLSVQGDQAFFVRSNTEGADIYKSTLREDIRPEPVVLIKGHLKKENSGNYLEGKVMLQSLEGDNKIDAFEAEPGGRFQFIAPYGKNLCLFPEAKGYFPIAEPINLSAQPIEELDYEGSNLLASVRENAAYADRDEEIVELQLHLRTLDDEMIALQEYRENYIKEQAMKSSSFFDKSVLTDPELDALKHRYQQQFVAPSQEAQQDTIPDLTDEERAAITKGEVEDMKARYMRFYEYETNQKTAEENAEREAQFMWSETNADNNAIAPEVLSDVEKSMRGKVEKELREELVDEVAKELETELTVAEKSYFDLDPDKLQQQLKSGLSTPEPSWTVKGIEKEQAWEQALKRDLELKLQEKGVQEEMKAKMEDEVKTRLKADMTYMVKQETRDQVASDLEKKMELQMTFESQSAEKAAKNADAVQPLIPFDEMDRIVNNIPEIEKDLLLVPAEIGMSTELKTVVFEANSAQLKPESYKELSRLLSFLQQNSKLIIEVGAHTGGQLSHITAYNLSNRRAEQIVNYLIINGIDSSRLKAKGYGKTLPIADNNTIEGQKKNQRIEVRIIGQQ